MSQAEKTQCINHPTVPAAIRCKQCASPACTKCVVHAPFGRFCSEHCRDQYNAMHVQAEAMQPQGKSSPLLGLRRLIKKVVLVAIGICMLGVIGTLVKVPVLTPLVFKIREIIGM